GLHAGPPRLRAVGDAPHEFHLRAVRPRHPAVVAGAGVRARVRVWRRRAPGAAGQNGGAAGASGRTAGRSMTRARTTGLAAAAVLALAISAHAQDAARLAAGEAAWNKAVCLQCHGTLGEGGVGGEFPPGPSLRTTLLNRPLLLDAIRCGRPGTQMPAFLDGAYTTIPCYGLPKGPPPAGLDLTPVLSGDEIEALVDYLMAKI